VHSGGSTAASIRAARAETWAALPLRVTGPEVLIMSHRSRSTVRVAALLATLVLSACGSDLTGPERQLEEDLNRVRQATEAFQNFDAAQAAGYTARLTGCMSDAQGGMGFHYGSPAAIDGAVSLTVPEVLLYEPQADGSLRLVGVEYIVPFPSWSGAQPPTLMGQAFHRNETFGLWALHAWIWRDNPNGVFADWNPRVSCAAARD
jgi:hypothetical protein